MLKAMYMMASLRMTKLMDTAYTHMLMAPDMKETGAMICKKAMDRKFGVTVLSIQVITKKAKSIVMEFMSGQTIASMRVIGLTIKLKGLGAILGLMEGSMKGIGLIIICMDKELILGEMVENMMVIIIWIKSMDLEFINGLMDVSTKANGPMEGNTEKVDTHQQILK